MFKANYKIVKNRYISHEYIWAGMDRCFNSILTIENG